MSEIFYTDWIEDEGHRQEMCAWARQYGINPDDVANWIERRPTGIRYLTFDVDENGDKYVTEDETVATKVVEVELDTEPLPFPRPAGPSSKVEAKLARIVELLEVQAKVQKLTIGKYKAQDQHDLEQAFRRLERGYLAR